MPGRRPSGPIPIPREAPELHRLPILPQPDDVTCGPACLHAVYAHHGLDVPLPDLIREIPCLKNGGRLAVQLGTHALGHGFRARLYTYNLEAFDPSWFASPGTDLAAKLQEQRRHKPSERLQEATDAYLEFLEAGGRIDHQVLSTSLLRRHLEAGRLLLAGVCATYLYGCAREIQVSPRTLEFDDVRGEPTGHFVLFYGHDWRTRAIHVADPLSENPRFGSHHYAVPMERAIGAVLLGALTWDGNFLVLEPDGRRAS